MLTGIYIDGRRPLVAIPACRRILDPHPFHVVVDRLADTLLVEATAPDGLIEAFGLRDDRQFLLGVQWHPEWRVLDDSFSRAIFRSFGAACRRFAHRAQHEHHHELV